MQPSLQAVIWSCSCCGSCWPAHLCPTCGFIWLARTPPLLACCCLAPHLQPNAQAVVPEDLRPLLAGILLSHPGLEFLQEAPEFQER